MEVNIAFETNEYLDKPIDFAKAFIDSFSYRLDTDDFEAIAEHILLYVKYKKQEEFKNSMRGFKGE